MFLGTYYNNLDAKNRLSIPSKVLSKLQNQKIVVISKGLEGCLELRTQNDFEAHTQKLLSLSQTKLDTRTILRQLLANASEIDIDASNRVLIPQNLIEEANLKKEVVIIGVGDKCEIWDKESYLSFKTKTDKVLEETIERVEYEK